jgi:hypothetical protein
VLFSLDRFLSGLRGVGPLETPPVFRVVRQILPSPYPTTE